MADEDATIDDYIAAQPEESRGPLERVRGAIRKALPRASEGISYRIPAYKLDGRMVLYFAGFRDHYSIYPVTPGLLAGLKDELAGRLHGKGTIRFDLSERVPVGLIARIAKLRAAEAAEAGKAKAVRKSGRSPKKPAPKAKPPTARKRSVRPEG